MKDGLHIRVLKDDCITKPLIDSVLDTFVEERSRHSGFEGRSGRSVLEDASS